MYIVRRPSRSTQGTVFRSPVEHAYTSSDVAVWVPRSADSRTCVVTVVRIVLARPRIVLARPHGYRNAISACASAQHAARNPRERRNTQNARRTHDTRRNCATRNTRELRSTKFEFRVQVRVGARRNPPRGPTLVAGWPSLLGAMEAVRRIRRVRFCMHLRMAVDSVMKPNFAAPGSYLELQRASSRSAY